MSGYRASVELVDDGGTGEAGPVVVEFRGPRTTRLQRFTLDEFTGAHLLHLAVAGCVYNDLLRDAAARGIALSHVSVTADGDFSGEPFESTGIGYRISIRGDASQEELTALVDHVVSIAEIPSALRAGAEVRLVAAEIASADG